MYADNNPPGYSFHFPKPLIFLFGAIALFTGGMFAERKLNERNTQEEVGRLTSNNLKLVATNKALDSDRAKIQSQLEKSQSQVRGFQVCLEQSGFLEGKWVKK